MLARLSCHCGELREHLLVGDLAHVTDNEGRGMAGNAEASSIVTTPMNPTYPSPSPRLAVLGRSLSAAIDRLNVHVRDLGGKSR